MQNYRLTIIAQFEKQHETLRNTALSREWEKLVELFESLPPTDRASVLATLADFIFAEGYLILRFPDESAENKRDRFREWLETSAKKLLGQVGFEHIVKGIEYSRVVECLYRDAYNECCKRAGDYDALSLIWAGIRLGHNEYVHWYQKAKGASKNGAASDRISKPLPSGTDGLESTFTDIVFKIDTVLQRELRFIGEQNGWFNDELQIPNHRKATAIQVAENRRNALAVFDKIEDSDTRTRLFAGVWRTQITGPSEGNKKITALLHPVDWQVALCVAGERLQRRIAQLLEKLTAKQTVNEDHVNSMASVVASAESPEHSIFHELTGRNVEIDNKLLEGLTACEWIRGYVILRFISQHYLLQAENASDPCRISRSRLQDVLVESGLNPSAARQFIEHCCFGRTSADLHDCSLLQVGNDDYCLLPFPANTLSVTRTVLSQLSKRGIRLDEKGTVLEERLQTLLTSNGIRCGTFHRKGAEEVEIDQVAVWDDMLFVFECKFYGLPSENARHQYAFCQNQINAACQLLSKVDAIRLDPSIVVRAVGNEVTWSKVVPVVLNGMPFSLPGMINGVYFADYASFERFFAVGKFYPFDPASRTTPDFPDIGEPVSLWSGDNPISSDLLRMLEDNTLFQRLASSLKPELVTVQVSASQLFCSNILSRQLPNATLWS